MFTNFKQPVLSRYRYDQKRIHWKVLSSDVEAISGRLQFFCIRNPQLQFSPKRTTQKRQKYSFSVVAAGGVFGGDQSYGVPDKNESKQQKQHKTSLLSKILKWGATLFVALLTFVALMPAIIMTPRGLGAMLYLVNTVALPSTAQIKVKKIQKFSWWEPIHAEGIQLICSTDGEVVSEIGEVRGTGKLLDTMFGQPCDLFISKPTVDFTLNLAGIPKLVHVLQGDTDMSKNTVQPKGRLSGLTTQKAGSTHVTGEFKWANLNIVITEGDLRMPMEINEAVGDTMYVAGALGQEQVDSHSKELDIDVDWVKWKEGKPAGATDPLMLQANAKRFCFDLKGWSDARLRIAPVTPPMISVDYTPALVKYFLAQVNPLLDNMVALKERGQVLISLHPADDNKWISFGEKVRIQISPMHVGLRGNSILENLKNLVDDSWRPWQGRTLDVQTTSTSFTVQQDAKIVTNRIDMLIGSQQKGIHIALWGDYNLQSSQIDMHIGLPQDTLMMIGLKRIPAQYVLPVRLYGDLNRPQLDVSGASREIAELTVRGVANTLYENDETFLGRQILKFAEQTLQQIRQVRNSRPEEVVNVPPLEQELPWETEEV